MSQLKIFDINNKKHIGTYNNSTYNKDLDTIYVNGEFYKPISFGHNFDDDTDILIVRKKSSKYKFAYECFSNEEKTNESNIRTLYSLVITNYSFSNDVVITPEQIRFCYDFIVNENCHLKAVKFIKEELNLGLKEAKDFIDYLVITIKTEELYD